MNIIAVLGNGTSIAYNPEFGLSPLTGEIVRRFGMQRITAFEVEKRLSELARAARPTEIEGPLSFEELLGPFDRMADGIEAMRRLTPFVPGARRHRESLEKAAVFGRNLYRRSVGTALDVVADLSQGQGDQSHSRASAIVRHLAEAAGEGGTLRIFTLNYDCLIDSAALDLDDDPDSPVSVSDMADGRSREPLQVLRVGGRRKVAAHPLREDEEYRNGSCPTIIYHLHGALNWVRDSDGRVWKARSVDTLRRLRFWRKYAQGLATVSPVVVLTDQKTPFLGKDPFTWAYRRLRNAITDSDDRPDLIVIAGYGFGDEPLNWTLSEAVPQAECPVVVIGLHEDEDQFRAMILDRLSLRGRARTAVSGRITVLGDGLPEALDRVEFA